MGSIRPSCIYALVTGSTSGIGLACAEVLARNNVNIIITGFADADTIDRILTQLRKHGVEVKYVAADLTKPADIEQLYQEILKIRPSGVDILVNNAGFNHVELVETYPEEKWDDMQAVLLKAPFLLSKFFIPHMKEKGWGRIVNIASQMGIISSVGKAVYSAAKSGLIGLTRGIALEVATHGITCNAVCPGCIYTTIIVKQIESNAARLGITFEQAKSRIYEGVPIDRMITVDEVADLVNFLCLSVASSAITGASHLIDGGNTIC